MSLGTMFVHTRFMNFSLSDILKFLKIIKI